MSNHEWHKTLIALLYKTSGYQGFHCWWYGNSCFLLYTGFITTRHNSNAAQYQQHDLPALKEADTRNYKEILIRPKLEQHQQINNWFFAYRSKNNSTSKTSWITFTDTVLELNFLNWYFCGDHSNPVRKGSVKWLMTVQPPVSKTSWLILHL